MRRITTTPFTAEPDPDPNNKGGYILNVAIADVAFYVRPGSALDRDALTRGNSVYFPDRVVPMLPERISNDLCSCGARRTARRTGGPDDHRLGRPQALAQLSSHPDALGGEAELRTGAGRDRRSARRHHGPSARSDSQTAVRAYATVKLARDERSPLDLDLPERKILLKPDGTS